LIISVFFCTLLYEFIEMAKIILDIPKDKMQDLVKALISLGIEGHSIHRIPRRNKAKRPLSVTHSLHKISSSFILFDWEFLAMNWNMNKLLCWKFA